MQLVEILDKKRKEFFSKIFRKKTKRFLSIDLGLAFVKIVYVESLGENFKLLNYDLKRILSIDENRSEIIEFITNFVKTNAISEKEVYLTIACPDAVIIKNLTLPAIPKEEILRAAKWEFKDEVPFDLEEALIDWQQALEYTDEEGTKKNEIIFILAEAKTVDRYLSIIGECGLSPVWISHGPFNYAYLLKHYKERFTISALLDIGYRGSTLCIYKNNKLIFSRRLTFSSDKLTQSLTATLVSDAGRLKLSYEEAENIKNTFGIPQESTQVLEGNIQAIQVISLIRPLLEELIRELRLSFDYFSSNFREERPSILYITGGGANLKNLDKYLNKELKIIVSELAFPDCIDKQALERERLQKATNQIINALGASLADARAINLLPLEIRTRKVELIERVSLRLVAITVGAIFLFSLFIIKLQISDYQNRLKNAQVHLQTISGIKALKQKIDLREDLINKIQRGRVPVDGLLKLISTTVPNEVILEELFLDTKIHSLILKGVVLASEDMAGSVLTEFMEKIETSSFFTEAALLSSKKMGKVQKFEIKCELVY